MQHRLADWPLGKTSNCVRLSVHRFNCSGVMCWSQCTVCTIHIKADADNSCNLQGVDVTAYARDSLTLSRFALVYHSCHHLL